VILGVYAVQGFFKLIGWLIPSTKSREFALFLFYAAPTLLVIGIVSIGFVVLLNAAGKQAAVPVGGTDAAAKAIGEAIANALTRYQGKRPPATQHNALIISIADFERALRHKLP
jgi:hypothetical protein